MVSEAESQELLIAQAYRLHNIYNACENMFRNIATVFENRDAWHSELLQRMTLDLLPLRPAVIDDLAYEKLDELRRFRYFFRTAYCVSRSGSLDRTLVSRT